MMLRLRLVSHAVSVGTNEVGLGPGLDEHAALPVAERGGSGHVRADIVAGDDVIGGARVEDVHAVLIVSGDEIAFLGITNPVAVAADPIILGTHTDEYSIPGIAYASVPVASVPI